MSAAAAAQRRLPALAAVEVGYLVGRRRPIDDLPPEKQRQIRQAYEDTAFCSDTCLEMFGFFTDLRSAEEQAARYPGGLVISLPVNGVLPDELGRYGIQLSNSPNGKRLAETSPGLLCEHALDRGELERLHSEMKHHVEGLRQLA